jgi:hypothetical protein
MENRKKFYSKGLWGKDTLQDRYEHVKGALEAYRNHILDDQDLVFVIKNAFVSKIYVSEGVAKAYPVPQPQFGNLAGLYGQLLANHVLDLQDTLPQLNTKYVEICELGTKVNPMKKTGKIAANLPSIRVEHVVPADVFMKDVKQIASFNDFKKIFDAVGICLVTEEEAKQLDAHHLRNSMPKGVDYTNDPFARYKEAGVIIYYYKQITTNQ